MNRNLIVAPIFLMLMSGTAFAQQRWQSDIRVLSAATKEVTEVSTHRVTANESLFSPGPGSHRPPLFLQRSSIDREDFVPLGKELAEEGRECVANCEATFAVGASRANLLRARAFLELLQGNLDRFTVLINEAIATRDQAVAQLRECLGQCPVLFPDFERSIADRVAAFIGW